MTPEREQEIREIAERVEQFANLRGDDIAGLLKDEDDSETVTDIDEALWCAHYALELLDAISSLRGRVEQAEKALYEIVGESYNLITQAESPTQLRQPSAQRIYDIARAARAVVSDDPSPDVHDDPSWSPESAERFGVPHAASEAEDNPDPENGADHA